MKVKFEPPHKNRVLSHCTNCQRYGRTIAIFATIQHVALFIYFYLHIYYNNKMYIRCKSFDYKFITYNYCTVVTQKRI